MSEPTGFTHLDDPAFLKERARLRGRLEDMPENAVSRAELEWLYETMTEEFLRRAPHRVDFKSTAPTNGQAAGLSRLIDDPHTSASGP